jgi:DNA-directed RNA polymerase specialized sigma24 family protein
MHAMPHILHIETLTAFFKEKHISSNDNDFHELARKEINQPLLARIENLPAKCKEVIGLYYMDNQNLHGIKTTIGMSASMVRSRLSYGLYLLKKQMAKKPKNPV